VRVLRTHLTRKIPSVWLQAWSACDSLRAEKTALISVNFELKEILTDVRQMKEMYRNLLAPVCR
jgi:hypothetical protein